ncbi:MAG: hypothetical protein JOZ93_00535 [Sinobacteraceae bacterium]|nr:hypothetical protein [Nevskiaceae bacterium]
MATREVAMTKDEFLQRFRRALSNAREVNDSADLELYEGLPPDAWYDREAVAEGAVSNWEQTPAH